jgi:2-polyprenyl-6-methoxyphenol hydroxylase-like FAD-dependent oxidoreductase
VNALLPDTQLDTVIVGGGQAGLAIGYYLKLADRRFVIVEAADRRLHLALAHQPPATLTIAQGPSAVAAAALPSLHSWSRMKGPDMTFERFFPTAQPDSGRVGDGAPSGGRTHHVGSGMMLSLPGDQS